MTIFFHDYKSIYSDKKYKKILSIIIVEYRFFLFFEGFVL
jgi:hypothetical protein